MRRKARTLPEGAAEQRCPVCPLANWVTRFPISSRRRKVQERRTGSHPMGRTLPDGAARRGDAA